MPLLQTQLGGDREARTGPGGPERNARRLPRRTRGGRSTCGGQGRSSSLLQRQPRSFVAWDRFPLLPARGGGGGVCHRDSQRALLWRGAQTPFPGSLALAGPARMRPPCLKAWHFNADAKAPG